ncbi:MAG: acetate--CoA ligase, partial [Betaproteobacteria bacterium]|nr:acetate--CoA ligase [Betaproteobacteria bacterium]
MSGSQSSIESTLVENRVFEPAAEMAAGAAVSGMAAYEALYKEAETDLEGFWRKRAKENLVWSKPFTRVLDESNAPFYKWFDDGELNASANCLDRHMGTPTENKTAIIFESDDGQVTKVTYKELLSRVARFANVLKTQGVKRGDRVIIYMPMTIEGVVAMQACARIGATHSVVFGGFSAKALQERIIDVGAVAVLTANYQMRGGKELPLKSIVDEAMAMGGCEAVTSIVVYQRTPTDVNMVAGRDHFMDALLASESDVCPPEMVDAEHPLFVLYTSGSTGKPKGVQHATGGYLLWARMTMNWTFDLKDSDVFWCTADIGWITGHTYVAYGPLAAGATQIVFEGVPTFPNAGRFWQMIDRHKCTIFYTAPTAIRSLIKAAESDAAVHPKQSDLSSLRILGSVGEPINPEAWMWYHRHVGGERCPIVDTFWQTETGGHVITPLPGATPLVPGSCTLPLPGIMASIVDESGQDMPNGDGGILVIKRPWPSMIRTIWGDPERFKKSYFPDELGGTMYLAGDGAVRSKDRGYFRITGRIDDVLNVSGHRMGTMEIESALVAKTDLVAEAAVVGRPDDVTGEAIVAFVVLKGARPEGDEAKRIAKVLRDWVGTEIGPIAKPKEVRFGDNLPKTRSGKIMRRLLRTLAQGETITQDT